jgi:hypothetical protein
MFFFGQMMRPKTVIRLVDGYTPINNLMANQYKERMREMKTEDLQTRGLTQEQIDYVMAEYGKELNGIKQDRDTYKTQLAAAQTTLKSFEGVNVQELQGRIIQLTADLANKKTEYQKQIADRDFNDLLKATAEGYKPRNLKAVMPFLDVEKLKGSKNQEADIKAALDAVKKDNAYLFQDVSIPRVVSSTPGPGGAATEDTKARANAALRNILGRE